MATVSSRTFDKKEFCYIFFSHIEIKYLSESDKPVEAAGQRDWLFSNATLFVLLSCLVLLASAESLVFKSCCSSASTFFLHSSDWEKYLNEIFIVNRSTHKIKLLLRSKIREVHILSQKNVISLSSLILFYIHFLSASNCEV